MIDFETPPTHEEMLRQAMSESFGAGQIVPLNLRATSAEIRAAMTGSKSSSPSPLTYVPPVETIPEEKKVWDLYIPRVKLPISPNNITPNPTVFDAYHRTYHTDAQVTDSTSQKDYEYLMLQHQECTPEIDTFMGTHTDQFTDNIDTSTGRLDARTNELLSCTFNTAQHSFDELHRLISNTSHLYGLSDNPNETFKNVVYKGMTEKDDELFVIKTDYYNSLALLHEAAVGLLCINSLFQVVPNFMYTYYYRSCSALIFSPRTKQAQQWCTSNLSTSGSDEIGAQREFVVLENIVGIPLKEAIEYLTFDQFLCIYIQIVSACEIANQNFGFTHYDLHDNNVIVVKHDEYVKIKLWNGQYLVTDVVPVIIDYGYVRVNYMGRNLGYRDPKIAYLGVTADSDFPAYDTYKLLLFCAHRAMSYNRSDILETCEVIYRQYGELDGDIQRRIQMRFNDLELARLENQKYYDYYQPLEKYRSMRYRDVGQYIIDEFSFRLYDAADDVKSALPVLSDWDNFREKYYKPGPIKQLTDYYLAYLTYRTSGAYYFGYLAQNREAIVQQFDKEMGYQKSLMTFYEKQGVALSNREFSMHNTRKLVKILQGNLINLNNWLTMAESLLGSFMDVTLDPSDLTKRMDALDDRNKSTFTRFDRGYRFNLDRGRVNQRDQQLMELYKSYVRADYVYE